MKKLSVASVQQRLLEEDQARKTSYETLKKNGARLRTIHSLNDPSTKITNIKQIDMPKEREIKSGTHPMFVLDAEIAGNYTDKMPRGIFGETNNDKMPKTPEVNRMKPNQTAKTQKVKVDMQKGNRKSESSSNQLWPSATRADQYVDSMERGNIFSKDNNSDDTIKTTEAKNLHGTTRPKSSKKTANMERWPQQKPPSIGEPNKKLSMPWDAPKKRSWDKVKSGILVRVNESVKACFDIVSKDVLNRMVENYSRFGYKVIVERSGIEPKWKSDHKFMQLIYEAVEAKENQYPSLAKKLSNSALNRFYHLCQSDYNNLYESREEFISTIRTAFSRIMENAIINFRKDLNLYVGKARLISEGKINDVEILAEGTDNQMALRLIRNKLMEHFGLGTDIKFIFIDGTKYFPYQIKEWFPKIKV